MCTSKLGCVFVHIQILGTWGAKQTPSSAAITPKHTEVGYFYRRYTQPQQHVGTVLLCVCGTRRRRPDSAIHIVSGEFMIFFILTMLPVSATRELLLQ